MKQTNLLGVKFNATPTPVPDKVKCSRFGCGNCLWNSCECKSGSMYKPNKKGECDAYTYCD